MRLLVSVINSEEALEALKGGCQLIDVKNPKEGSLGANFPSMIKKIREIVPEKIEVSAAAGDMPNLPGTASLAALGVAAQNVNYVKIGLKGPETKKDAVYLMKNVVRSVKDYNSSIRVVAAGYADSGRVGCLDPLKIPEVAYLSGADVAMIDVGIKDGKKLFDFLEIGELKNFVKHSHRLGLLTALAGSLGKNDVEDVFKTDADIFGVRGAVCNGNRVTGKVKSNLVKELVQRIDRM